MGSNTENGVFGRQPFKKKKTSKKQWMQRIRDFWPARNVMISTKPSSLLWKLVKVLLFKIHIPANGLMRQLLLASGLMACLTSLSPVGVLLFILGKCSESCQTSSPSHLRFYLLHLRQLLHRHGFQCLLRAASRQSKQTIKWKSVPEHRPINGGSMGPV